jgi:hypothetical protein
LLVLVGVVVVVLVVLVVPVVYWWCWCWCQWWRCRNSMMRAHDSLMIPDPRLST